MALYLVVHTPVVEDDRNDVVQPPTRLRELAEAATSDVEGPRWLKAWSPDLLDDRIFTLWEAASSDEVRSALELYGFLNDLEATPIRVREWGPEDVLNETT